MGLKRGNYATVWDVARGKYGTNVRLSTSYKKKDGTWEQDFSGTCSFIWNAKDKALSLKPKDRIRLGDVDVTTSYNKETGKYYTYFKVFDFTTPDEEKKGSTAPKAAEPNSPFGGELPPIMGDEDCPW